MTVSLLLGIMSLNPIKCLLSYFIIRRGFFGTDTLSFASGKNPFIIDSFDGGPVFYSRNPYEPAVFIGKFRRFFSLFFFLFKRSQINASNFLIQGPA